ncbi:MULTISPECIES: hypothetical protein [unclassified Streptomyces]|uniref:hypothetical protein n=1 Tax=Streptomyces TaxID=1883 RepID=UPI000BFC9313|nr:MULTISPECIES: hypothetical protein [unclassified Streptomyces]PVD03065.1 hypothetical protein DBP21_14695 [Streptomyces sp. CS147]
MDVRRAVREPREIDASGLPMEHAQAVILDALRALTEREEPFAAILLMPTPPEGRTPPASGDVPAAADRIRTLKAIRPGLTEFCRGLAFVAPADIPAERAEAIHSGEQLWGCPTTATQDVTAARAWAEERGRE